MLALGNNEALEKEAAKIARKRLVNEQRKERILNPRRRTIGIDVDALDQQVAEHNRLKDIQAEEDKMEKMRSLEIERILAASSEEEKMMRYILLSLSQYTIINNRLIDDWPMNLFEQKIPNRGDKEKLGQRNCKKTTHRFHRGAAPRPRDMWHGLCAEVQRRRPQQSRPPQGTERADASLGAGAGFRKSRYQQRPQ